MALQSRVEISNSGVAAEYWRITHRSDDYVAGVICVTVHGYVSSAARDAGKFPVAAVQYRLDQNDIPQAHDLHAITTGQLYAAVRQRSASGSARPGSGVDDAAPIGPASLDGALDC